MSNDMISVLRELLERIERMYMDGMSIYGECEEIRTLLAQPNTCTKDGGPVHAPEQAARYTYASKQETNCAGCGVKKHTPLRVDDMGGYVCLTCIDKKLEEFFAGPAQSPVVLPKRKQWGGLLPTAENLKTDGWNAYDDELKRLNSTL